MHKKLLPWSSLVSETVAEGGWHENHKCPISTLEMSAFCYKEPPPPANRIFFLNKFYFFERSLLFPASCFHCLVCISFRNSGIRQGKCSVYERTKSKKKWGKERTKRNEWKNETSSFSNAEGNSAVKASEEWRKRKNSKRREEEISQHLTPYACTANTSALQRCTTSNSKSGITCRRWWRQWWNERTNERTHEDEEKKPTTRRREREREKYLISFD